MGSRDVTGCGCGRVRGEGGGGARSCEIDPSILHNHWRERRAAFIKGNIIRYNEHIAPAGEKAYATFLSTKISEHWVQMV